jgi:hypothetical protein
MLRTFSVAMTAHIATIVTRNGAGPWIPGPARLGRRLPDRLSLVTLIPLVARSGIADN